VARVDPHTAERAALTRHYQRQARRSARRRTPVVLISAITRHGRQNQPRRVTFTRHNVVRPVGPRPRAPGRPFPAHTATRAVTPREVAARQAHHQRALKSHRRRIRAKIEARTVRQAQARERTHDYETAQRAELTRRAHPQLLHVPSQGNWFDYTGPHGSVTGDLAHTGSALLGSILRATGHDPASQLRQATTHSATEKAISDVVTHPLKTGGKLISGRTQLELSNAANPSRSYNVPKKLFVETPRALIEHPSAIPKTLKGLAELPLAVPAGTVSAIADPVGTAKAAFKDVQSRYGESDKAFRDRIGKEGAASEVADASLLLGPSLSAGGRGLTRASRHFPGSRTERFLNADRPKLRATGGETHRQELSPNAFRASMQRIEDRARATRTTRRNARHPEAKPGIQPGAGEVVPLFERRAQRVATSKTQTRHFQRFSHERAREIEHGVMRNLGRLNRHQRRAVGIPLQGTVPLADKAGAIARLVERRKRIVKAYQAQGHRGVPKEAREIDHVIEHADEIFTPQLAKFHAAELARHERIGHVGVSDLVAEVRRHRPQAEELGIDYPYEQLRAQLERRRRSALRKVKDADSAQHVNERFGKELDALEARKPEIDRQFVETVKAKAADAGLPEPVYVQHFKHKVETEGRSAFALGGRRAAAAPKRTTMELHRTGRADVSAQAYVQSTARIIKRRHNWQLIADTADTHAFRLPDEHELQEAFGHRHVQPGRLTADQWHTLLEHRGVDPKSYALWSPGRFQREVAHGASADEHLHPGHENEIDTREVRGAVNDSLVPADKVPEGFVQEQGVRLLPREVYDEIHATVKGSSLHGRVIDKVQALQSRYLLGLNPSWEAMQIGANAFQSVPGLRGNLAAFVKSPLFWRQVPPEVREAADELLGTGLGRATGHRVHLGAAVNSRIVDGYRALRESLAFKSATVKNAVPVLRGLPAGNPIDLMFALDHTQTRYFKRTVLYNDLKRQAFRDMAAEGGAAFQLQGQISHMLTLGPKDRIEALIHQGDARAGRPARRRLHGQLRPVHREGTQHAQAVCPVLRVHALCAADAFYTLPVKHPIIASIAPSSRSCTSTR
jgi:hypothetical protein